MLHLFIFCAKGINVPIIHRLKNNLYNTIYITYFEAYFMIYKKKPSTSFWKVTQENQSLIGRFICSKTNLKAYVVKTGFYLLQFDSKTLRVCSLHLVFVLSCGFHVMKISQHVLSQFWIDSFHVQME